LAAAVVVGAAIANLLPGAMTERLSHVERQKQIIEGYVTHRKR